AIQSQRHVGPSSYIAFLRRNEGVDEWGDLQFLGLSIDSITPSWLLEIDRQFAGNFSIRHGGFQRGGLKNAVLERKVNDHIGRLNGAILEFFRLPVGSQIDEVQIERLKIF